MVVQEEEFTVGDAGAKNAPLLHEHKGSPVRYQGGGSRP
jgi:hypothetical protein